MPQFTLKKLFLVITLIAAGMGGVVFQQRSDWMPKGSQWVWLNVLVMFGSFILIGIALVLPFRGGWLKFVLGVILGLIIAAAVIAYVLFFNLLPPCH